jgi:tetratricopeptide (TPR) repeat protein
VSVRILLALVLAASSAAAVQTPAGDGLALIRQGRYREAKPLLERAVKAEPRNAAVHYGLGLVHLNADQDFERAADRFEKAVDLDSRNAEYHYQLGVAYGRIALTAGALRQIGLAGKVKRQGLKAIELDPNHVEARKGMIQFYMAAPRIMGGSKEKARGQAAEIARIDPYEGELGWALIASSERNSAEVEKRYRAALALDPDGWQALQSYGSLCLRRNRSEEALEVLTRLAAVRPEDPRSHELLGDALIAASREAEGLRSYDKALALRTDYDPAVYKLARFHERKGDTARAAEYYRRYLDLVPTGRRADQARARLDQWEKRA